MICRPLSESDRLLDYEYPDLPLYFLEELDDYYTLPEPLGMRYFVSPSSLNTFIICPAKFLWEKVCKVDIPEGEKPSADIGIKMHKWAEHYIPKLDRETIQQQAQEFRKQEGLGHLKANLLRTELELPETNVVATELKLKSEHNMRNGYLDRVDIRSGTNKLLITDYKPVAKMDAHTKRQLVFYAVQLEYLISNGLIDIGVPKDAVVTHARTAGYKDGKNAMVEIKKQSKTAMEKQVKKLRESTHFPAKLNQGACRFCKFADNLCLEANYESI